MDRRTIALWTLSCLILSTGALILLKKRTPRLLSPQEMDLASRDRLIDPGAPLPDLALNTLNGKSSLLRLGL